MYAGASNWIWNLSTHEFSEYWMCFRIFSFLLEITCWMVDSWLHKKSSFEWNPGVEVINVWMNDSAFGEYSQRHDIIKCELLGKFCFLGMCWFLLVFERSSNSIPNGFRSPLTSSTSFLSIAVSSLCRKFRVHCKKSIVNWNICVESEMNIWMLDFKAAIECCNQIHWTGCLFHRCQPVCSSTNGHKTNWWKKLFHSDWKALKLVFPHLVFEFVFRSFWKIVGKVLKNASLLWHRLLRCRMDVSSRNTMLQSVE